MFLTDNSDARNKFMEIVTTIENTNKDDRMMKSLVKKNNENLNRRMLPAKFDELMINKDKLSYLNPNMKKPKSKYIKSSKKLLFKYKSNKINNNYKYQRYLTESISEKCFNKVLGDFKDDKNQKNDINIENNSIINKKDSNIFLQLKEEENDKIFKSHKNIFRNEKKDKKLEDLKTFFQLLDIHQKTQYNVELDPSRPKLNFLRNNDYKYFKSSVTYDKKSIYFNKKYSLIFDQINNNIKTKTQKSKKNNYIMNSDEIGFKTYSSNLSKQNNKNSFIKKKKKLYKINSVPYNLFLKGNKNKKNKEKIKDDMICIRNELYSLSDDSKKINKNTLKNDFINKNKNLYINNNNYISNYVSSSRPQTSVTSISNKTKLLKTTNETIDIGENSSLSLLSDTNNLKLFNNSKKYLKNSKHQFRKNLSAKIRNKNKKLLYDMLSDNLEESKKIKNNLNFIKSDKEKKDEMEKEKKIKELTKKKKTDLDLLKKELNLYYNEKKIDLENLVINNVYNMSKHLQNLKQFKIMNNIANKVIVEDKILNKEIFLESSLARKLRKRIKNKNKNEIEFETLIEKRKYLKNKIIKYKEQTENKVIKRLMKNDMFDYDDIKSLDEMIYKYRTMSHH